MKLVVFRGDAVEFERQLRDGVLKVGRDPRADVVLNDPQKGVSRFHCEVRTERGKTVVADTNSRNGIFVDGKRVKGSAEMTLGVPVVVGPFELMLEYEASTSLDEPSSVNIPTQVSTPSGSTGGTGPGAATLPAARKAAAAPARKTATQLPPWLMSRQNQMLAGAAVLIVLLGGVTWLVVRTLTAPAQVTQEAAVVDPAQPPVETPTQLSAEEIRSQQIAEAILAIRNALIASDAGSARSGIQRLRDLDSGNAELPSLEADVVKLEMAGVVNKPVIIIDKKPTPAPEPDNPEIPRRPNEDNAAYQRRQSVVYSEARLGREALSGEKYAVAINHFSSVLREAPGFGDVEVLLNQATATQRAKLANAIDGGEKNEAAGDLKAARAWYESALTFDPNSPLANEKLANVRRTLFERAQKQLDSAGFNFKSGNRAAAAKIYQAIIAMLEPKDELYVKATQGLEAIK